MKALILAGGRGKRLGSTTDEVNKCMLPVHGRPLIEYSLAGAAGLSQITEILVVVGYRAQDIMGRYGQRFQDKPLCYVEQKEQKGLVHAIECARELIGSSDFMLMLADELMINPRHEEFVREFESSGAFALCGVLRVSERALISKTYSVLQSPDGGILRLIEKPARPANDIMGTGNCIFKNAIFDYIAHTPINQKRKEKELPDLIQCAIDDGHQVRPFLICQAYANVNDPQELLRTESYFAHL